MGISLTISLQRNGETIYRKQGTDEVFYTYRGEYQKGDRILIAASESPLQLHIQLDASLPESLVYLKDPVFSFLIPFEEEKKPYGQQAFSAVRHYGQIRVYSQKERYNYRNLALNAYDFQDNETLFPHVLTNVPQTNPQFYARNVIDGVIANQNHGSFPHGSWSIGGREDAWLRIDFGKEVYVDEIHIYLRADFPHDTYFEDAQMTFSDGKVMKCLLRKTADAQIISLKGKALQWIELSNFKRAKDPSPFAAISQIVVMGWDFIPEI